MHCVKDYVIEDCKQLRHFVSPSYPIFLTLTEGACCAALLMEQPLELLLMPGLAFDRQGHRLGRGGG